MKKMKDNSENDVYSRSTPLANEAVCDVLFTCTLCNTNFDSQKALERHIKNLHEAFNPDVKMYQSNYCNYHSFYKYNVMRHEEGKHKDELKKQQSH